MIRIYYHVYGVDDVDKIIDVDSGGIDEDDEMDQVVEVGD